MSETDRAGFEVRVKQGQDIHHHVDGAKSEKLLETSFYIRASTSASDSISCFCSP